ncbi:hypothetical protein [Algoriphagus sp.]|uniref:hypothetical protein n=1 Tax=Algoriphagus sp. TaxID=1872435 RepID=UPI002627531C|nr:hypothetical protein [Algoriphagus sp.]
MRLLLLKDFLDLIFPVERRLGQAALLDFEDSLCTVCHGIFPVTRHYFQPKDDELYFKSNSESCLLLKGRI